MRRARPRRRVAAELIADLERVYQRKKAADKELKALVAATGTTLMDPHGIGPSGGVERQLGVVLRLGEFVAEDQCQGGEKSQAGDAASNAVVKPSTSADGRVPPAARTSLVRELAIVDWPRRAAHRPVRG